MDRLCGAALMLAAMSAASAFAEAAGGDGDTGSQIIPGLLTVACLVSACAALAGIAG